MNCGQIAWFSKLVTGLQVGPLLHKRKQYPTAHHRNAQYSNFLVTNSLLSLDLAIFGGVWFVEREREREEKETDILYF